MDTHTNRIAGASRRRAVRACLVEKASYRTPQELKAELRTASILKSGRVVFIIGGNKYRVVLAIDYQRQLAKVRFVGTHAQYDRIDAENI